MATNMFLKIDGIDGDSRDKGHLGHIDIESFSWGETQSGIPTSGQRQLAGVKMQPVVFTMRPSKVSPLLIVRCAEGRRLTTAALSITRPVGSTNPVNADYLRWIFTDFFISGYQSTRAEGQEQPLDQFSLVYVKVRLDHFELNADGSILNTTTGEVDLRDRTIVIRNPPLGDN